MWYFTWVLGVGLAVAFGILNGMWHEFQLIDSGDQGQEPELTRIVGRRLE
jgi:cyd operon protein YbgT